MATDLAQTLRHLATAERLRKQRLAAHWDEHFAPGQRLLCCGEWQPITALPHQCSHCQRRYFEEVA